MLLRGPSSILYLTIFNKIAIQGTPQIAVDKVANSLSRESTHEYYYKCNLPLFYVYPALTRYVSILFLNILTLLACTHYFDNLFQTLMCLWENENFLTSSLLCFFTSVKLCPLVFVLSLISKTNIRINIFITIQYLKHFYLIPLNLCISSVVSPHSISMSFLRYGLHGCTIF